MFNDSVIRTETGFVSSCCCTFISVCWFFLPFFVSVISSLCLCSQPAHLHIAHPLTNQMRSWCQQQLAAFDFAAPQWPDPGLVHSFCVHAGVLTAHLLLRLEDFLCVDEGTNSATFFWMFVMRRFSQPRVQWCTPTVSGGESHKCMGGFLPPESNKGSFNLQTQWFEHKAGGTAPEYQMWDLLDLQQYKVFSFVEHVAGVAGNKSDKILLALEYKPDFQGSTVKNHTGPHTPSNLHISKNFTSWALTNNSFSWLINQPFILACKMLILISKARQLCKAPRC